MQSLAELSNQDPAAVAKAVTAWHAQIQKDAPFLLQNGDDAAADGRIRNFGPLDLSVSDTTGQKIDRIFTSKVFSWKFFIYHVV